MSTGLSTKALMNDVIDLLQENDKLSALLTSDDSELEHLNQTNLNDLLDQFMQLKVPQSVNALKKEIDVLKQSTRTFFVKIEKDETLWKKIESL